VRPGAEPVCAVALAVGQDKGEPPAAVRRGLGRSLGGARPPCWMLRWPWLSPCTCVPGRPAGSRRPWLSPWLSPCTQLPGISARLEAPLVVTLVVALYFPDMPAGARRLCLPERRPTQPARPQGLAKNLVTRAFPEYERPDYLTSAEFFKFTPSEEFLTLPGDISRTEFRLVRARLLRPPRGPVRSQATRALCLPARLTR
jgi:hypothetical protein